MTPFERVVGDSSKDHTVTAPTFTTRPTTEQLHHYAGRHSTTKLAARLDQARPLVVSADIDGLVSATMLASVARNFEIVAFLQKSATWLVHPGVAYDVPANAIAVDLFSPDHDSISNHVILWGARNIKAAGLRDAFVKWDQHI